MSRAKSVVLLLVPWVCLSMSGCVTAARVDARYSELVEKWKVEHPGTQPTEQDLTALHSQAATEVEEEVEREREEAAKRASETGLNFATGNIIAGLFGLVGLAGLGVAAYKKSRGKA